MVNRMGSQKPIKKEDTPDEKEAKKAREAKKDAREKKPEKKKEIRFKEGMDKVAFDADLKTQSAILHQLIVIGEAVKRLSPEFRDSFPEIPWSPFARMRDRLIHGYDTIDLEIVWRAVENDIPELLRLIQPLLPSQ